MLVRLCHAYGRKDAHYRSWDNKQLLQEALFLHVYIRRSSVSLTHSSTTCRSGSQDMKPVGQSATSYLLSTSQLGAVFIRSLPAINKVLPGGAAKGTVFLQILLHFAGYTILIPSLHWLGLRSEAFNDVGYFYLFLFNFF